MAPLLPPERRRDARLIATAMAIVLREAQRADWPDEIVSETRQLYAEDAEGDAPPQAMASPLRRLAVDLRNGAFENSPSRAAAARAILWRLTIAKLRENNPDFLAANGIAGERGESE